MPKVCSYRGFRDLAQWLEATVEPSWACHMRESCLKLELGLDVNADVWSESTLSMTAAVIPQGFIGEEIGFDPLGFSNVFDMKWLREAHAALHLLPWLP